MKARKKLIAMLVAVSLGLTFTIGSQSAYAQGVDSAIKKVGNKTASIAVKGTSTLTDKIYKGKEGPNGQVVYIDKRDRKFIVNDRGKKVYLKPSQIHDKKKD
ncbi:hypothetical protein DVR12_08430 [Chitinophaga silvatica]|uniref:PBCV-specific basic adaptor domain-containing protein n=1 Tax=Chitinophaga silvatica TaxID=2282649 RepID=A0A3E1YD04_9BACT|nr:hypothetical protein [Chitinophaga silvatica]RFS23904.1 hypothetical protein DVR12_08430 [Chitinophaga silvatica]